MKKIGMLLFFAVNIAIITVFAGNYALLVGINEYKHYSPLKYAQKDAEDLQTLLRQNDFITVLLTGNRVTKEAILGEIEGLLADGSAGDTFLFFFSGHGRYGVDQASRGLLTHYANEENAFFLSQQELEQAIAAFPGKRLFLLDACYQGQEEKSELRRILPRQSFDLLVTASAANQPALDGGVLGGRLVQNGLLTFFFLEALRGKADQDNDRALKGGEIKTYLELAFQDAGIDRYQTPEIHLSDPEAKLIAIIPETLQPPSPRSSETMARVPKNEEIAYDYLIARYETTYDEFDRYCEDEKIGKPKDSGFGRSGFPVANISWWEAVAYCNWKSETEGFAIAYDEDGNYLDRKGESVADASKVEGYRLPIEVEWQRAAKGIPLPKKPEAYAGSAFLSNVGWWIGNSGDKPQKVGGKAPNALGLYDMSGNVWEMCQDLIPGKGILIKGGGWQSEADDCRIATIGYFSKTATRKDTGFRICRTVP